MYAVAKQLGVEKRRVQRNVKRKTRACKKRAAALSRYVKARRVVQSLKHQKDEQRKKRMQKRAQRLAAEGKEIKAHPGKRKGGDGSQVESGGKRARASGGDTYPRATPAQRRLGATALRITDDELRTRLLERCCNNGCGARVIGQLGDIMSRRRHYHLIPQKIQRRAYLSRVLSKGYYVSDRSHRCFPPPPDLPSRPPASECAS